MTHDINIAFAFEILARKFPDRDAIIAEDLTISYSNLWRVVERFAAKMQSQGVGRKSVVGIDTTDMIVSVASLFSLSMLGAAHMSVDRDLSDQGRDRVTHLFRSPERNQPSNLPFISMDETWSPKAPSDVETIVKTPGYSSKHDICWILGSSGTTGRPKQISIDQETVWKRVAVVKSDYEVDKTRIFLVFPCNTRPFGIRAIATLLSGGTIIDSHDSSFLQKHGVNLICGSPVQLVKWINGRTLSPKISKLQVSGARLDYFMALELLNSFDVIEDVYGSSETIASYVNSIRKLNDRIDVSGHPIASTVQVVDSNGAEALIGQAGLIRIRNDHMARGYDALPEETVRRFVDGWFYPGDLAKWEQNGVLRILGRDDDVVNLGGRKINLADLDAAMAASPLVMNACSFSDPRTTNSGQLCACVKPSDSIAERDAAQSAWEHCVAAFGPELAPATILVVPEMLLTDDGVPRRHASSAAFLDAANKVAIALNVGRIFKFHANPK